MSRSAARQMRPREWVAIVVMVLSLPILAPMSQVGWLALFTLFAYPILIVAIAGNRPVVYGLVSMNAFCISIGIHNFGKQGIENVPVGDWIGAVVTLIVLNLIALGIAWPFHLAQKRRHGPQNLDPKSDYF